MNYDGIKLAPKDAVGPYIYIGETIGANPRPFFEVRFAWKTDDGKRVVLGLGVKDNLGKAIALLQQVQASTAGETVKLVCSIDCPACLHDGEPRKTRPENCRYFETCPQRMDYGCPSVCFAWEPPPEGKKSMGTITDTYGNKHTFYTDGTHETAYAAPLESVSTTFKLGETRDLGSVKKVGDPPEQARRRKQYDDNNGFPMWPKDYD